ncbi:MAG TPA: hypothetical protein VH877_29175 [Polyangia bacterium]|jgi:hypothetical protein|nr:hypothetical protein [Polyangia bacterium]
MSLNRSPLLAPRVAGPILGISLLLIGGAVALRGQTPPSAAAYRLYLSAPEDPRCYYGSAWNEGPVVSTKDPRSGRTSYVRKFQFVDGCYWQATETLVPMDNGTVFYDYEEHVLSCNPGAVPAATCPRQGFVTVEPAGQDEALTPTPTTYITNDIPEDLRQWRRPRSTRHASICPYSNWGNGHHGHDEVPSPEL